MYKKLGSILGPPHPRKRQMGLTDSLENVFIHSYVSVPVRVRPITEMVKSEKNLQILRCNQLIIDQKGKEWEKNSLPKKR